MSIKDKVQMICELNGVNINDVQELVEIDSLKYLSIITSLESEFHIEFPDEIVMKNCLENIDDLCEMINMLPQVEDDLEEIEEEDDLEEDDLEEMLSALDDLESSREAFDKAREENDNETMCAILDDFFEKHCHDEEEEN